MSIYVCYRGDCDNLALQQPGDPLFVAQDALGRNWLCIETRLSEIPSRLPDSVAEVMQAQKLAHKQGLSVEGTQQKFLDCPDEARLRRQLILDTYPPKLESADRLRQAGWIDHKWSQHCGKVMLIFNKGQDNLTAEGDSENEAWYRAAQKALGSRSELQKEKATMSLTIQAAPAPLRTDEYGVVRVGNSQVLLDVVIREFKGGAGPEDIAGGYSTLELADIYAVIAYYLRHQQEVDEYLQARREAAERQRGEIESKQPGRAELRAKLLARKAQMEQGHASPSK